MIDEVLREIKNCEENADQLQKDAYQKGKQIVLDAENAAEKQKKDMISECKQDIKNAQLKAEEEVQENRRKILLEGEKKAKQLIKDKNADMYEMSEKIVKKLLEKY